MADKYRMNPICVRVEDHTRMRLEEISRAQGVPMSVTTRVLLERQLDQLYDSNGYVKSPGAKGFGR